MLCQRRFISFKRLLLVLVCRTSNAYASVVSVGVE